MSSSEEIIENGSLPFASVDVPLFLNALVPKLRPPVANRVWFEGTQFFVMIVGGPNSRDDFHYQPGEELFYMYKGDMNLDVMEGDIRKRVPIAQDQMFLLPKLTHHSPQRQADTIGIVFERIRKSDDVDYLKWFSQDGSEILYQESFHCGDINNALKPVIGRFLESPACATLKATPKVVPDVSSIFFPTIIHLPTIIDTFAHGKTCKNERVINGEFVVDFYYNSGTTEIQLNDTDSFIFQSRGSSTVTINGGANDKTILSMVNDRAAFLPKSNGTSATIENTTDDACIMIVTCIMP